MRIIAGSHKGHRLVTPKGIDTRPTGDRVREAAFNLIGPVTGATVLDLFAGSGAMGLEALSRGAERAVFVESDRDAVRAIEANLDKLGLRAAVTRGDAVRALAQEAAAGRRYDLVLVDPPYRMLADLMPRLQRHLAAVLAARRPRRRRVGRARGAAGRGPGAAHEPPLRLRAADPVRARMITAICPGSYDPVTLGHVDVITRAAAIFDRVVVGVVREPHHKKTMFSVEERVAFLGDALTGLENVEVDVFSELVVDFARRWGANTMVKGLRVISDFEWEYQMNHLNRALAPDVETLYVMSSPKYSFVSSSGVKEIAAFGGKVDEYVPGAVARRFEELFPDGRPGAPLSPQE